MILYRENETDVGAKKSKPIKTYKPILGSYLNNSCRSALFHMSFSSSIKNQGTKIKYDEQTIILNDD